MKSAAGQPEKRRRTSRASRTPYAPDSISPSTRSSPPGRRTTSEREWTRSASATPVHSACPQGTPRYSTAGPENRPSKTGAPRVPRQRPRKVPEPEKPRSRATGLPRACLTRWPRTSEAARSVLVASTVSSAPASRPMRPWARAWVTGVRRSASSTSWTPFSARHSRRPDSGVRPSGRDARTRLARPDRSRMRPRGQRIRTSPVAEAPRPAGPMSKTLRERPSASTPRRTASRRATLGPGGTSTSSTAVPPRVATSS